MELNADSFSNENTDDNTVPARFCKLIKPMPHAKSSAHEPRNSHGSISAPRRTPSGVTTAQRREPLSEVQSTGHLDNDADTDNGDVDQQRKAPRKVCTNCIENCQSLPVT